MFQNNKRWELMAHRIDSGRTQSESQHPSLSPSWVEGDISINGVIDVIMEVGAGRTALLGKMRRALLAGNDEQALRFARQLCGLSDEKSSRTHSRIN